MRTVAQLLLMCDGRDLGLSVNAPAFAQAAAGKEEEPLGAVASAEAPRIFIYDNYPGGIGFSAPLFEMQDRLLEATGELIAGCECERGCPSCVGPIGEIGPLGKRVALDLLARLTGKVPAVPVSPPALDEGDVPF
jgi:DEAD/DEAH box helicase domain-containing protein